MRVMTQNIRSFPPMRQKRVRADVRKCMRQAAVIGWQEIDPRRERYRKAILIEGGDLWDHYFGGEDNNAPISWRKDKFALVDNGELMLHPGHFGVCRKRMLTWVVLEKLNKKGERTGKKFLVTNAHYVPGAWAPGRRPFKAWRQQAWNRGSATHQNLIARFRRSMPTVNLGDFNRRGYPVLGKRKRAGGLFKYLVPKDSIDYVVTTDTKRARWKVRGRRTLGGRFTDHKGRRVRIVWKRVR